VIFAPVDNAGVTVAETRDVDPILRDIVARMAIALVTDSTATLSAEVAEHRSICVIPLHVIIGAKTYTEGQDLGSDAVANALAEGAAVNTSRPTPQEFVRVYEALADAGASQIVSIHLSGDMSGTYESAQMAAREARVRVRPLDSRMIGMGTGFAALTAADAIASGADIDEVVALASKRADETTALFYVDTLEHLRRGGRIGPAAALLGSALAVKPLLQILDGRIVPMEKVRTRAKALTRLEELAVEAAGDGPVDVAIAHLSNQGAADQLAEAIRARVPNVEDLVIGEVGAVIAAHVGPGMVSVVVAPRL
jgi:DegV family protein with EDD domain